ncbi:MAG: Type 1 glutamine amidotransferase-like domain-containing protein [Clostridia bacterium]|nr:Type 1 glutamine amidotransferase-like domain-containing protein [Clostridia bacterium]
MGKIVALGGGRFDNGEMDNVTEHIISLTEKKNPLILIIPTASFDNMDENDDVKLCFEKFGCSTDILFLTHEDVTEDVIKEKISSADGIFVQGGNLKFLMDTWKETKTDKYLLEAYEKGTVLSGASSGAMCWFKEGYDDCIDGQFVFVEGLDIIPYINCPHYQSEYWQTFEEALVNADKKISGIACDNGAGFCINDGVYYTVAGNEDGDCYFYDANDSFRKTNINQKPELLKVL